MLRRGFFRRPAPAAVAHLLHHLREVDLLGRELHLARFDLGQVEHVVDELQQMARALEDVAEVLLLRVGHRAGLAALDECREADDGVERGAQLMRHVGEELAFQAARLIDAAQGFLDALALALVTYHLGKGQISIFDWSWSTRLPRRPARKADTMAMARMPKPIAASSIAVPSDRDPSMSSRLLPASPRDADAAG